jgi:hypothetical protein
MSTDSKEKIIPHLYRMRRLTISLLVNGTPTVVAIVASSIGGGFVFRSNKYRSTAKRTRHAIVDTKRPKGTRKE